LWEDLWLGAARSATEGVHLWIERHGECDIRLQAEITDSKGAKVAVEAGPEGIEVVGYCCLW